MNPLNKPAFWLLSLAQYHHASTENNQAMCNLVPRLHAPAFLTRCEKSWGVEPGNEANAGYERFDCSNVHTNKFEHGSQQYMQTGCKLWP